MYIHTFTYTYAYMYACMCKHFGEGIVGDRSCAQYAILIHLYYIYTYTYIHMYICTHTYICTHAHIYIYMCMYTHSRLTSSSPFPEMRRAADDLLSVKGSLETAFAHKLTFIFTYIMYYIYIFTYMYVCMYTHSRLTSSTPFSGMLRTDDDSLSVKGSLETAFARVHAWPQFLHINTAVPVAATTSSGAVVGGAAGIYAYVFIQIYTCTCMHRYTRVAAVFCAFQGVRLHTNKTRDILWGGYD